MKCSVLRCPNEAIEGTEFCSGCKPSGLVLPMKRTDEQNAVEAKKIREEVTATLTTLVGQLDVAKAAGYVVSFNIQVEPVTGKHYIAGTTQVARQY